MAFRSIFKYLLTAVGVPMFAQQIRHETQKVSSKLMLITFISTHQKNIIALLLFGLFGSILTIEGICLTLFTVAQNVDLAIGKTLSASLFTSLGILLVGVVLDVVAWTKYKKLESRYFSDIYASQHHKSFFRTAVEYFLRSFAFSENDWSTKENQSSHHKEITH